jgi:hypothetical protein
VERADLLPGDVLMVCAQKFLLAWVGPQGEVFPAGEQPAGEQADTQRISGLSATD